MFVSPAQFLLRRLGFIGDTYPPSEFSGQKADLPVPGMTGMRRRELPRRCYTKAGLPGCFPNAAASGDQSSGDRAT
jgi:hypothetical protein